MHRKKVPNVDKAIEETKTRGGSRNAQAYLASCIKNKAALTTVQQGTAIEWIHMHGDKALEIYDPFCPETWNEELNRFGSGKCQSGLMYKFFHVRNPEESIIVKVTTCNLYRKQKDETLHPNFNLPNPQKISEKAEGDKEKVVKLALEHLDTHNTFYLVLLVDPINRELRNFRFGRYSDIPNEYWYGDIRQTDRRPMKERYDRENHCKIENPHPIDRIRPKDNAFRKGLIKSHRPDSFEQLVTEAIEQMYYRKRRK